MAEREAFEQIYREKYGKIRYACDENGCVTHVIKRIDPEMKEVYLRLMKVQDSHLAVIYAVTEEEGQVLVHQEYIDGESVDQWTHDPGDDELIRLAKDVACALRTVHALQPPIIHRDVKPGNIMRRKSGGYVLVDFDAGRVVKHGAQGDTQVIGTVGYAAPEQFGLRQSDARTDIFSLGATLFWLKTGQPVHEGSRCSGKLGHIIKKCTQLDPARRYQNAEALLRALRRAEKRTPLLSKRAAAAAAACLIAVALGAKGMKYAQNTSDAAYADCTCRLVVTGILPAEERVQLYRPGDAPVELQMRIQGYMEADGCTAKKHRAADMAAVRDAHLVTGSQGTEANVESTGSMTLAGNGVYAVEAGIFFGGEMTDHMTETIVLTHRPQGYENCGCTLVQRECGMQTAGDTVLRKGGTVRLTLTPQPVFDLEHCSAREHAELFWGTSRIEEAPPGAVCSIEGGNELCTDTAGRYAVRSEYFFGLQMVSIVSEIWITEEA